MSDTRSYLYDVVLFAGSIGSSVGLLLVTKLLMITFHFHQVFILTAMHLLVNAVIMEAMAVLGRFERKTMPLTYSAVRAVYCVGSIASLNATLVATPLWFHQATKLVCVPILVFMQTGSGVGFSGSVTTILAIVIVCFGIAAVTVFDVTPFGIVFAAFTIYFTAKSQLLQRYQGNEHVMSVHAV